MPRHHQLACEKLDYMSLTVTALTLSALCQGLRAMKKFPSNNAVSCKNCLLSVKWGDFEHHKAVLKKYVRCLCGQTSKWLRYGSFKKSMPLSLGWKCPTKNNMRLNRALGGACPAKRVVQPNLLSVIGNKEVWCADRKFLPEFDA